MDPFMTLMFCVFVSTICIWLWAELRIARRGWEEACRGWAEASEQRDLLLAMINEIGAAMDEEEEGQTDDEVPAALPGDVMLWVEK